MRVSEFQLLSSPFSPLPPFPRDPLIPLYPQIPLHPPGKQKQETFGLRPRRGRRAGCFKRNCFSKRRVFPADPCTARRWAKTLGGIESLLVLEAARSGRSGQQARAASPMSIASRWSRARARRGPAPGGLSMLARVASCYALPAPMRSAGSKPSKSLPIRRSHESMGTCTGAAKTRSAHPGLCYSCHEAPRSRARLHRGRRRHPEALPRAHARKAGPAYFQRPWPEGLDRWHWEIPAGSPVGTHRHGKDRHRHPPSPSTCAPRVRWISGPELRAAHPVRLRVCRGRPCPLLVTPLLVLDEPLSVTSAD